MWEMVVLLGRGKIIVGSVSFHLRCSPDSGCMCAYVYTWNLNIQKSQIQSDADNKKLHLIIKITSYFILRKKFLSGKHMLKFFCIECGGQRSFWKSVSRVLSLQKQTHTRNVKHRHRSLRNPPLPTTSSPPMNNRLGIWGVVKSRGSRPAQRPKSPLTR